MLTLPSTAAGVGVGVGLGLWAVCRYSHRVGWTPLVGNDFADHHDEGLPRWNLNVKCVLRIQAQARVSDPVGANVGRITRAEISSREIPVQDVLVSIVMH